MLSCGHHCCSYFCRGTATLRCLGLFLDTVPSRELALFTVFVRLLSAPRDCDQNYFSEAQQLSRPISLCGSKQGSEKFCRASAIIALTRYTHLEKLFSIKLFHRYIAAHFVHTSEVLSSEGNVLLAVCPLFPTFVQHRRQAEHCSKHKHQSIHHSPLGDLPHGQPRRGCAHGLALRIPNFRSPGSR